ncbi:MAG: molybdopterin molybdenumtransferase MoeA [Acidimicrobiia bacterium]|nr:molybdopterin molybdenumtransferase MoeA [Acidimicrobiia bacterium]
MRELAEARKAVLSGVDTMDVGAVALSEARGRILAEDTVAEGPVPPFDNSAMDGYAVRGDDVKAAPTTLQVIGDVRAGHVASSRVGRGEAIRIMTGAPLPEGSDTVVRVEDTDGGAETVTIMVPVEAGRSVRRSGGDVAEGDVVLRKGTLLGPRHLGVLATIGHARPLVYDRPKVAILSTGDEVRPPETPRLAPGEIRDANRALISGLLGDLGIEPLDLGIVGDDRESLESSIHSGLESADAMITSGGVSVGTHDLLKEVLADLGEMELWRVAMKPAKPFAFGHIDSTPIFGLPGNPVSVFVAFEQFVRPALLRMQGVTEVLRPRVIGVIDEDVTSDPEKEVFLRVRTKWVDGLCHVRQSGGQESNMLAATAAGDAFAVVPLGISSLKAGDPIEVEIFSWPHGRTP